MNEIALIVFYITAGVTAITGAAVMYKPIRRYQAVTTFFFGVWMLGDAIRWYVVMKAMLDSRAITLARSEQDAAPWKLKAAEKALGSALPEMPALAVTLDWMGAGTALLAAIFLVSDHLREKYRWMCMGLMSAYFGINAFYWAAALGLSPELREHVHQVKAIWSESEPSAQSVYALTFIVYGLWTALLGLLALVAWRRRGSSKPEPEEIKEAPRDHWPLWTYSALMLFVALQSYHEYLIYKIVLTTTVLWTMWSYFRTFPRQRDESPLWASSSIVLVLASIFELSVILWQASWWLVVCFVIAACCVWPYIRHLREPEP